ncbi:MAG TPA: hypothetical protein PLZ71_01830 [Flavobacterium alvei]|nr:hypothetical protein [Flavobacterium alvei]HQF47375.1 hypothetical protein [Flavobacterium alvei]
MNIFVENVIYQYITIMNKFLRITFLSVFFLSCSSDLDFEQVNDLKLEPIAVANLAAFDIKANQFVVGGVEQSLVGDVMDFDVFSDVDFSKNLSRVDLFFEFNNTINRAYNVNFYLLDDNNSKLYTIPFFVPANSGSPIVISKTEIFENTKLDILIKTKKVAFVITMLPGTPLTDASVGNLKMRSSATIYFLGQ